LPIADFFGVDELQSDALHTMTAGQSNNFKSSFANWQSAIANWQ
jgi:hypothetical protein